MKACSRFCYYGCSYLLPLILDRPVNCDHKRNYIDHAEDAHQCVWHTDSRSSQGNYCRHETYNCTDQPNLIVGHNVFALSFHNPAMMRIQATRNIIIDSQSGRMRRNRSNAIQPVPNQIPIRHKVFPFTFCPFTHNHTLKLNCTLGHPPESEWSEHLPS